MGLRDRWSDHKLSKDGIAAEAAVLSKTLVEKRQTGVYVSTVGESAHYLYDMRFVVEVRPTDGEPFQAEIEQTLKQAEFDSLATAGHSVPVRYDPKDHSAILDMDALEKHADELSQGIAEAQAAKDAAVAAGADPAAARMEEANSMLQQLQGTGFMSPGMESLAAQGQTFMQQWQASGAGAGGAAPMKFPTPTTGTVLGYETLGSDGPVTAVRVRVSYQPPGAEPVETTLDTAVSPQRIGELATGAQLPILVDGNDPTKVYPASSLL